MNFKKIFFSFLVIFSFSFLVINQTQAATSTALTPTGTVSLENPIKYDNPVSIISAVIKGAIGIMGSLALIMVVMGARKWLMAGGNADEIESGTKTITWAILGIILTLASYILIKSILNFF